MEDGMETELRIFLRWKRGWNLDLACFLHGKYDGILT